MPDGRSSALALRVKHVGQGDNNCPSEGCNNCCRRCSIQGMETLALLELELQEGVNHPQALFSPLAEIASLPLSRGKRNFLISSLISPFEQKSSTLPSWWGQQEGERRVKPGVTRADKAALPQPPPRRARQRTGRGGGFLPRCSPLQGQRAAGSPAPPHTAMQVGACGPGAISREGLDRLGSCLGTSWLWDQQDVIIYEHSLGQQKLLCFRPKWNEVFR